MPTVVFPEIGNDGFTTLNGAITNVATTINLVAGGAAALTLSDSTTDAYLTIIDPTTFGKNPFSNPETHEIVQVTAISTEALTVTRGVDGTSGTAFANGSYVMLRTTAATIQRIYDGLTDGTQTVNVAGNTGTFAVGGILSVDDVTDTTSAVTGSIHTDGGVGIAKELWVGTVATVTSLEQPSLRAGDIGTAAVPFNDAYVRDLYLKPSNAGDQPGRHHRIKGNVSGTTSANTVIIAVMDGSSVERDVMSCRGDLSTNFAGSLNVVAETNFGGAYGSLAQSGTGDGTTTITWALGNHYHFQFGAFNETFTFTAPTQPGPLIIRLIQDSVGSRTATWPATVKWSGATAPTLTTTATTGTDVIEFYYDGTNYRPISTLLDSR